MEFKYEIEKLEIKLLDESVGKFNSKEIDKFELKYLLTGATYIAVAFLIIYITIIAIWPPHFFTKF